MKRRKTGRRAANARVKALRSRAPKAAHSRTAVADKTTIARVTNERDEALHQQAATSEILKLISSSPADTQPVFDAIVRSGLKIFPDAAISIALPDGDKLRTVAFAATDPVRAKMWRKQWPIPLTRAYMHSLAFLDRKIVDVPDARKPPPEIAVGAKNLLPTGYRALTIVPLMRGRSAIGTLSVARLAPGRLTKSQFSLFKTFANQAVIAIENTRVLGELRESLQQQTATADVLKVISRSTFDLQAVLQTLIEAAARLCEADSAAIHRPEGDVYPFVASFGYTPEYEKYMRKHPISAKAGSVLGRALHESKAVQIADVQTDPNFPLREQRRIGRYRTVLGVPLLREGLPIGVLILSRFYVREFTQKQIELVETFADQAVIAIENARLLNELRSRTDDLTESLEQQTATSEVLQVISKSPGELEPVFQAVLENAVRICEAKYGVLFRHEQGEIRHAAMLNVPAAHANSLRQRGRFRPESGHPLGRLLTTKKLVHTIDASVSANPPPSARLGGARTHVAVPMLKDDELIGAIVIYRQEVRPFTDKQIELVQNFAAQAVIAIENTRLLNELRQRTDDLSESLEQQTATAEVLKVISSSPGDMKPVFEAMLANALRICEAKFGHLLLYDGERFHATHLHDVPRAYREYWEKHGPIRPAPNTGLGRIAREKLMFHIPDLKADAAYAAREPLRVVTVEQAGARSFVGVPMLKEDKLIGAIVIYRQEVRPFTERQIELLKNFAAQAVIAIENTRLLSELRESLQQQTATADVLKVISRSTFDLDTVLSTLSESATRLCEADGTIIWRPTEGRYRLAASYGLSSEFETSMRQLALKSDGDSVVGRTLQARKTLHVPDISADPEYAAHGSERMGGYRGILGVPLMREGVAIGVMMVGRLTPKAFTEAQIALVTTFADQAVMAIENTRLLTELRESLQQQTATADVLKVISSSPGDLEPVFSAILANATGICGAKFGTLYLRRDDAFYATAFHNAPPAFIKARKDKPLHPSPESTLMRAARTKQVAQVLDATKREPYRQGDPFVVAGADLGGYRTIVSVPMLKDDELIGVISIYRQEVLAFTDKQIELVSNFAAQAVIAIENARLLSELRESLQQQTATSDVLKVISRSTFDLNAVLRTLVESATRLCEAEQAIISQLSDDGLYRIAANYGFSREFEDWAKQNPFKPGRGSVTGRTALEAKVVHVPDVLADPEYTVLEGQKLGGYRSNIGVPLLRDGVVIGVFVLTRPTVKPFTDKQIELVRVFADQAVIAIENARLLDELRESLQQQTATADVLKVISRSTFDLKTVLTTLVETAVRVCEADIGNIARPIDNDAYKIEASFGQSTALYEELARQTLKVGKGSVIGRTALNRAPVHILDAQKDPDYELREALKIGDYHTMLGVPMVREGNIIGVFGLARKTVRAFTEKQIELVTTFADQAVIAIENVRLFESVEARTRELAKSLEDLRSAQDRLVQTQKLASLGQLTAGIAHEIKNPLNFVNNFSVVSSELIDELHETLKGISLDDKRRAEVDELTTTLRSNLDKVVQHGKRADAIVKNMLLHSREGSGEHRVVDINALVEESLNLAYHGARAEKQGFSITLERSFDAGTGAADLFPQEITRVLLNLIVNGFYAATKRKAEAGGNGYEPTLMAATRSLGDSVEIRIRDNGTGIPPDVKEKIFNPFFTTKPAGEGTGLGLSISHDIIVKQHGGSIEVDTRIGEFTEFRVILPRAGAALAKSEDG